MLDLWNHIVADFSNIGSPTAMAAFFQVLMIDIVLDRLQEREKRHRS